MVEGCRLGDAENTDGGDVVRWIVVTPVMTKRVSDEITAVRLVPQLVLLKTSQRGKHPYAPSGGVRISEDTGTESGYNARVVSRNDEGPPIAAFPPQAVGSSSLGGPSVAFRFDPSGEHQITQR